MASLSDWFIALGRDARPPVASRPRLPIPLARSLALQVLALFALVSLLAVGFGLATLFRETREVQALATAESQTVARQSAAQIAGVIQSADGLASATRYLPAFWDGTDADRDAILAALHRGQGDSTVVNALLFYTNDFQQHGASTPEAAAARKNISGRDYARRAVASGQPAFTAEPLSAISTGVQVLPVAFPIREAGPSGRVGFVVAGLKLAQVQSLWSDLPLPRGGTVLLADTRAGRVLAARADAPAPWREKVPPRVLEDARAGGGATRLVDSAGVEYLVALNRVEGTPWVVVVAVPSAAVFGPLWANAMQRGVLYAACALLAFALLWGLWFRLSRRLRRLEHGAERWAEGDWAHRVGLPPDDELGRLGVAFDAMADRLHITTRALRESERLYRTVARHFPNGAVALFDRDLCCRLADGRGLASLGVSRDQLEGRTVDEAVPPTTRAPLERALRQALAGAATATELALPDGVFLLQAAPVRMEDADTDADIAAALLVALDVTAQTRAAEALRQSEERLHALAEGTLEGIVVHRDGVVLEANQAMADLFGYALADLPGLRFLSLVAPDARDAVRRHLEAGSDRPFEFRALRRDGSVGEFEGQGRPFPYQGGLARVTGISDIGARKALERMKSNFVSMVSHELRTPLTSIKGYLDLLMEGAVGDLADDQREFLGIALRNANRLVELVSDLLDLSRLEEGRLQLHREMLDLPPIVDSVVTLLRPQIEAKHQHLSVDVDAPLPPVYADPNRVAQIVTNLLSNAHKYTPEGGQIAVRLARADGHLCLDVRDSGIGLSEEDRARLFTRFFRSDNPVARAVGGTGLGLVITRSLVEQHGGTIGVESAPGAGSTFSVRLPLGSPGSDGSPPTAQPVSSPAR